MTRITVWRTSRLARKASSSGSGAPRLGQARKACADRRTAHRHRSAGSPPSHPPALPWRTPRPAGRPTAYRCPAAGRRGEPFVQRPSALFRECSVQLLTLLRERSVQLHTLLVECLFGIPAGCAAAEILGCQGTDQGKDADAGRNRRRNDFRVHKRNLVRLASWRSGCHPARLAVPGRGAAHAPDVSSASPTIPVAPRSSPFIRTPPSIFRKPQSAPSS